MDQMSSRTERAAALERWADRVEPEVLRKADREALQVIAALAGERDRTNRDLATWVARARESGCTWSQIGAQLGVSKQAAQQKFGTEGPEVSDDGMDL